MRPQPQLKVFLLLLLLMSIIVVGYQGVKLLSLAFFAQEIEITLEEKPIYFLATIPDVKQLWQVTPSGDIQEIIHQVSGQFRAKSEELLFPTEYDALQYLLEDENQNKDVFDVLEFKTAIAGPKLSPQKTYLTWVYIENWCYQDRPSPPYCFGTSQLEILNLITHKTTILYRKPQHLDAHNNFNGGSKEWSLDEKYIAFIEGIWEFRAFSGGQLKLINVENLATIVLSEDMHYPIAWSEDSQKIASTMKTFNWDISEEVPTILIQSITRNMTKTLPLGNLQMARMEWYGENQILFEGSYFSDNVDAPPSSAKYGIYVLNLITGDVTPFIVDEELSYTQFKLSSSKRFLGVDVRELGRSIESLRVFDISEDKKIVAELPGRRDLGNWTWGTSNDEILVRMSHKGQVDLGIFSLNTNEFTPIPWPPALEEYLESGDLWISQGNFTW